METQIKEKEIKAVSGWLMLFVVIVMVFGGIALMAAASCLRAETTRRKTPAFSLWLRSA